MADLPGPSASWLLIVVLATGCAATEPHSSDGVIGSSGVRSPTPAAPLGVPGFPGEHWERVASPEAAGFSTPKLATVRALLEDLDTTAAMVIVHGRVLFQYGEIARVSYVASIRKSILGMLFGEHVARGEIAETSTLAELSVSVHPAYHMYLSTRDMARVGYLMLRSGSWNGKELVPPRWIAEMLTPTSGRPDADEYEKGMSFGKLWWIFDDSKSQPGGPLHGAYTAMGAYGPYITVIPKLDMVVAHKVVHKTREKVEVAVYRALIDLLVACRLPGE